MGLLDTVKKAIRGKGGQIEKGIDKVADVIDDKTKGKHSSKIENVAGKAKGLVDKLDDAPDKGAADKDAPDTGAGDGGSSGAS
jgi:hypothetical protein